MIVEGTGRGAQGTGTNATGKKEGGGVHGGQAAITLVALLCVVAAAAAGAQTKETIAEIRVHGNHTTPDADILAIAGLKVGEDATEARLNAAVKRLEDSDRFDEVELLRRYRSIANASEILVMLVVEEHPGVSESDLTPGPFTKLRALSMWLPIITHADGYGFTYGAVATVLEPFGKQTRLAVPLTWGGERRAAVDLERRFENGPFDFLRGTFSVSRRINPHFLASDRRFEAKVRGERTITSWLRAGAGARVTDVHFGALEDQARGIGADVTVDTRLDPSFPRNAVYASTGIERLSFDARRASRWSTDLRAYIGAVGSTVIAVRGSYIKSDAPLPPFEQTLLGGSGSLRGYRTGHRAGDNVATTSIELRVPLNSPLSIGRFGAKTFVDWGASWAHGGRLGDQQFDRGIGGGVFFGAGPLVMDLDVAWPRTGNPRVHFGLGLNF